MINTLDHQLKEYRKASYKKQQGLDDDDQELEAKRKEEEKIKAEKEKVLFSDIRRNHLC